MSHESEIKTLRPGEIVEFIVACRADDPTHQSSEGQQIRTCTRCEAEVIVDLRSQRLLDESTTIPLYCLACFARRERKPQLRRLPPENKEPQREQQ